MASRVELEVIDDPHLLVAGSLPSSVHLFLQRTPLMHGSMVDQLGYLDDLSVHRLLMGRHTIELGCQLVYRLTKSFVSLGLGRYEALHETF